MKYEQFIQKVQKETHLDNKDQAETLTKAVIETLGERLDDPMRENVKSQLPCELREPLMKRNHDVYEVPDFYNRVGARSGMKLRYYDSAERTWQVMKVLRQALPPAEVEKVIESLPNTWNEIFGEWTPGNPRPRP